MILTARPTGLENVLSDARRAALRRSEPVTLLVSRKGTWEIDEVKSGLAILSGAGMPAVANDLRIDVSALGLCTPGRGASPFTVALDPFTCSFASP